MKCIKSLFLAVSLVVISPVRADDGDMPLVYKAMNDVYVPYDMECPADPGIVQEYLLELELDYLRWLSEGQKDDAARLKRTSALLSERENALVQLRNSCL